MCLSTELGLRRRSSVQNGRRCWNVKASRIGLAAKSIEVSEGPVILMAFGLDPARVRQSLREC